MRNLVLTTMLLASNLPSIRSAERKRSLLCAVREDSKSEAAPAQTDQNSQQARNPQVGREQSRAGDREMDRDWRMHRDDDDNMSRSNREPGPDWRMRDRDTSRGRDTIPDATEKGAPETGIEPTETGTTGIIILMTTYPAAA